MILAACGCTLSPSDIVRQNVDPTSVTAVTASLALSLRPSCLPLLLCVRQPPLQPPGLRLWTMFLRPYCRD